MHHQPNPTNLVIVPINVETSSPLTSQTCKPTTKPKTNQKIHQSIKVLIGKFYEDQLGELVFWVGLFSDHANFT